MASISMQKAIIISTLNVLAFLLELVLMSQSTISRMLSNSFDCAYHWICYFVLTYCALVLL